MGARTPGRVAGLVCMFVSAVFMSTDLISKGVREGLACSNSATEPETIGAAPEVPPKAVSPLPVPFSAETDAPGAPMSGLIVL